MKNWLLKLTLASLAVLAPAKGMILTCFCLIVADLITGLLAAKRSKEPITSRGFRRTTVKLFVYESAIILGYLTQTYLTGDSIPVASIIAGFIGITELLSVLENLNIISNNNLLKALLEKLNQSKP